MKTIEFLNIDLDIESEFPLQAIIDGFGDNVTVMYNIREGELYKASFELTDIGDPEQLLNRYVTLVESLNDEQRRCWDQCTKRVFDIGYDSGHGPDNFHSALSSAAIASLSRVGGGIVITVYPVAHE